MDVQKEKKKRRKKENPSTEEANRDENITSMINNMRLQVKEKQKERNPQMTVMKQN